LRIAFSIGIFENNMQRSLILVCLALAAGATVGSGEITVVIDRNESEDAAADFHFSRVPPPATNGAVTGAQFKIVDGDADSNSGGLEALNDGRTPDDEDQPERNFFFDAGTRGGTIQLDLKKVTAIWQINTYSWHTGSRAPQVYKLYGATGAGAGFNPGPQGVADPTTCGWTLIASVDTRSQYGDEGGQYGVSIRDSPGKLGDYRYFLFVCAATETSDAFGNTFYSKIDVLDHPYAGPDKSASKPPAKPYVARTPDGNYEIAIDSSRVPDMKDWAESNLAPVLVQWYPKIVALLPSDGYTAPQRIKVIIRPGDGVADTAGTRITAYVPWIRKEAGGQAVGALVHEMVHVVQQYGDSRHNPDAKANPGWLVEGMADYVRWYLYEPQSHGADIAPGRLARARYNHSYRTSANFLNWVSEKYDKDLVPQINAVMRQGNYDDAFWTQHTGKSVQQLGDEWKAGLKDTNGK
jgi:hypothetical protein